jgi:hypothetical protein
MLSVFQFFNMELRVSTETTTILLHIIAAAEISHMQKQAKKTL